jgi:hypothetical protein
MPRANRISGWVLAVQEFNRFTAFQDVYGGQFDSEK